MGETSLTASQVQHLVQQMGQHYKGNKYHLLQLNCNHFASDLCLQLTGKPAPSWVSRGQALFEQLCLLWVVVVDTSSRLLHRGLLSMGILAAQGAQRVHIKQQGGAWQKPSE